MSAEQVVFERTVQEALRRFRLEAANNPNIIGSAPFTQIGTGAIPRTVLSKLQETIDAADFGVIGDGVTDDTAAVQLALNAGATQGKVVNFRALVCLISGALTSSGPGFMFDTVSHGDAGGPGFLLTGTGYTAMTVTGMPQVFAAAFYGTGNTVNGVQFQNPILSRIQHCRVFKIDGFGVKVNRCFDCVFETISVEQCGNATNYAFSVNDDTETSNMSRFVRIQCEKANTLAIFVSANTLSCVFDDIHSEQATAVAATDTWYLGGSRCQYNVIRVAALVAANATLHLVGGDTTYNSLLSEGAIAVSVEGSNTLEINGCEIQGTLTPVANQTARIVIIGGSVAFIAGQAQSFRCFGVNIGTLTVDFANNPVDVTRARYYNCDIAILASSSTLSAATFDGCLIAEGGNLLRGATVFNNCDVTCAGTVAHSSGLLQMSNSTLHAALTYTNHAAIRLSDHSRITGTVSCGDGGNVDFLCDDSSTIGAGSTGVGIPTDGAHVVGDRHRNPLPAAGQPLGWNCTVAGTPGTFVAEASPGGGTGHTLTFGAHLTSGGASYDGSANVTITPDATSANTPSTIVARDGSGAAILGGVTVDGAAGTVRPASFTTASSLRWRVQANNVAESGGDAGSNLAVIAYTDAGAQIDVPIFIARVADGTMTIGRPVAMSGTAQITGQLTMGADIQLGNTFVAGAPVATGYVILKDAGGTPYKVLVAP